MGSANGPGTLKGHYSGEECMRRGVDRISQDRKQEKDRAGTGKAQWRSHKEAKVWGH